MSQIVIKDGVESRCPKCRSVYKIQKDGETIFRKIWILYQDTAKNLRRVKCHSCGEWIEEKLS